MKMLLLVPFVASILSGTSFATDSVRFFSQQPRLVAPLKADPREQQLRVGYLIDEGRGGFLELDLGGHLGVAEWTQENERRFVIEVRAGTFSRFRFGSRSFDLQNIDYQGGIAAALRLTPGLNIELWLSHTSSHLGDDLIGGGQPIQNVSGESLRLLADYRLSQTVRTYFGCETKWRSDPANMRFLSAAILGAEYLGPNDFPLSAALDIRVRSKLSHAFAIALSIGFNLGSANEPRPQRLVLQALLGPSPMGQMTGRREFSLLSGIQFHL